jgi:hypothetical protein
MASDRARYLHYLLDQLGFLASSTPFVTGRPVTLFHDGEIYSDGAIGIALQLSLGHTLTIEFPGLVDLTPDLQITRYHSFLLHLVTYLVV